MNVIHTISLLFFSPYRSPLIFENETGSSAGITNTGITNTASSMAADGGGESVRRGKVIVTQTTTTGNTLTTPGAESAISNQSSDVEELQQIDQGKM